jgi:hypothetical protein
MVEKMDLDKERARIESEKKQLEDKMKLLEEQQRLLDEKRRLGEEMKLQKEKARKRKERKLLLERQEAEKRELVARQQKEKDEMEERQRQEALQYHDEEEDGKAQKVKAQKVETPRPSPVEEKMEIPEIVPRHETIISEKGSRQTAVKLRQQKEIESLWDEVRPPPPPPRHALHHKKGSHRQSNDQLRLEGEDVISPSPRSPFHKMSFEREDALRSPPLRSSFNPEDVNLTSSTSTIQPPKQSEAESSKGSPERTTFGEETPPSPDQLSASTRATLSRQSSVSGRESPHAGPANDKRSSSVGVIATPSSTGNVANLSTLFSSKAASKEKSDPKVTTLKAYGNGHGSGKENGTVRGKGDVKEVYGTEDKSWTHSKPRLPFPGKYFD